MPSNKDMLLQMLTGGLNKGLDMGASGAKEARQQQADMAKQAASSEAEKPYKDAEVSYRDRMASVAEKQAETNEQFRQDQIRIDKLKSFLGAGGSDKGLSSEAQKTSNLIDTGRQSLNNTESLLKKHPIAGMIEKVTPNWLASTVGGSLKDVNDSKNHTKEALQAAYTGAAASGEQVPAFQAFSGPGLMDIASGNVEKSDGVRDAMNTLQKGYSKQKRSISPEMLKAAGMENDPIAQQAMKLQSDAAAAETQKRLSMLTPEDQKAHQWMSANPQDPAAAAIRTKLFRKYGNL